MNLRPFLLCVVVALAPLSLPYQGGDVLASQAARHYEPAVTEHEIEIGERTLAFEARVEMLELSDEAGTARAHLFTVAYLADDHAADRPVTFLMNGGPGASSAYLHVGGIGPWTIRTDARGRPVDNGALRKNPESWLAHTDLVFLDPVGTGFSRPVDPEDQRYYDREADLDSLAQAMELWLERNGRHMAPVYLAGESYGGYRAAALPERLIREAGVSVAGSILVSPVIDFAHIRHHAGRPMSWAFVLPSYAAAAAGHDRAEPVPAARLRSFALEDYLLALVHPERMEALLPRLAEITGLDEASLRERGGRVRPGEFRNRLLGEENRILSSYDALISFPRPDRSQRRARIDPVLDATAPAFVSGILSLLRERLDWPHGRDYRLLNRAVNRAWSYGSDGAQGYVSAMRGLRRALALDEDFRVLAGHGETDLVTPWLASEWLLGQIAGSFDDAEDRIVFRRYRGGHMFYMRGDSNARLSSDVAAFFSAP